VRRTLALAGSARECRQSTHLSWRAAPGRAPRTSSPLGSDKSMMRVVSSTASSTQHGKQGWQNQTGASRAQEKQDDSAHDSKDHPHAAIALLHCRPQWRHPRIRQARSRIFDVQNGLGKTCDVLGNKIFPASIVEFQVQRGIIRVRLVSADFVIDIHVRP
jgi:hypothetical protein